MASWQSPTIHSTGEIFSVSDNNILANNEIFLYQRPYANYYNSVATSLPNGTIEQISLGGTTAAGYGFSISSNSVVVPLTGIYWVSGQATTNTSGAYPLAVHIEQNGTLVGQAQTVGISGANPYTLCSTLVSCTASDTIGLYAVQSSGSTVLTGTGANNTFLTILFVGSI